MGAPEFWPSAKLSLFLTEDEQLLFIFNNQIFNRASKLLNETKKMRKFKNIL